MCERGNTLISFFMISFMWLQYSIRGICCQYFFRIVKERVRREVRLGSESLKEMEGR